MPATRWTERRPGSSAGHGYCAGIGARSEVPPSPGASSPPSADPSDAVLVAAAQSGDRRALDTLLRRHVDRMHALCRRMTGSDADADDATQEALMAVVRGVDRFDGRASFATWVYRVATNACLDELRRRGRRPTPAGDDLEVMAAHGQRGSAEDVDGVATRLDVDAALARLPAEQRAAVVLRDLLGLDYASIAEILEIAPGTVRSRIARGRSRLADLLAERNRPPETDRPIR